MTRLGVRAVPVRGGVAVLAALMLATLGAGCGGGRSLAPISGAAPAGSAPPSPSADPSPSAPPSVAPQPVTLPAGVVAGVVVFDRQTGAYVYRHDPGRQFRSASLVKLLIVLDYLWDRGPAYAIPATDRPRLDVMLRSSDDAAGTYFWKRGGQRAVVSRMVDRLGLKYSAPPPVDKPGFWGYTALSADDVVTVYRYLLDQAPAPVRDFVMGNLRQSTTCGTDHYDQSFGIPATFQRPWAAKQGWSGFPDRPVRPCTAAASVPDAGSGRFVEARAPDMLGEVLHTTGTVGPDDRSIVAILSVHPDGSAYATATTALNKLTGSLRIPGAVPAS